MADLLYKFMRLNDYCLASLYEKNIYFGRSGEFNDPFDLTELSIKLKPFNKDDLIYYYENHYLGDTSRRDKMILKIRMDDYTTEDVEKKAKEFVDRKLKSKRIYCCAGSYDNVALWAHYADNHSGICLEIDPKLDPGTFRLEFRHPVEYHERRPDVDFLRNPTGAVQLIMTNKFNRWSFEDETRYIVDTNDNPSFFEDGTGLRDIDVNCITAIYFGMKCSDQVRNRIKRLTKRANYSCKFYSVEPIDSDYQLQRKEL